MKSFRKILVSSLISVSIFGGFFAPQADVHAAISKSGFTQTVQAIQYYKNTYGTVTASVLNVRSSAGGSIIGKATKGQKYQVTASTQYSGAKWYQIKFGTRWGWVHSSYLNISTSPTTTPTINKYATVTASALNVRSTPGGTIIGSASRGQKYYVTTSKTYNGATWYCIKYGTRTGWVHGSYLSFNTITTTPITTKSLTNGLYGINITGSRISCGFDGYRNTSGRHEGIDFAKGIGSSIYSLTDGVITGLVYGYRGRAGLSTIAIYDSKTNKTVIYLHAAPVSGLYVGKSISRRTKIATEDWRGCSTSSSAHTHVEVRFGKFTRAAKSVNHYVLDNPNPSNFWKSQGYIVR